MQRNGDCNDNGNGGRQGHPACASCKHQRKKCVPECELAPYFPASRVSRFKAVHDVFGVSNILKMLKKVPGGHQNRLRAVESLVWEAEWRQRDIIQGPYSEYQRLLHENQMLRREKLLCARCGNGGGMAGVSLNNIIIHNNNNNNSMHSVAPLHTDPQDTINYLHHNGKSILEPNHHHPHYVRGLERGGAKIRNGNGVALPQLNPMDEFNEHHAYAQHNVVR